MERNRLTFVPAKNERIQRELLRFEDGVVMLRMSGFRLQTGGSTVSLDGGESETAEEKVKRLKGKISQEQEVYAFDPTQKLQALVPRDYRLTLIQCTMYNLVSAAARG